MQKAIVGDDIDGVFAVDPVFLQYMLGIEAAHSFLTAPSLMEATLQKKCCCTIFIGITR